MGTASPVLGLNSSGRYTPGEGETVDKETGLHHLFLRYTPGDGETVHKETGLHHLFLRYTPGDGETVDKETGLYHLFLRYTPGDGKLQPRKGVFVGCCAGYPPVVTLIEGRL